MEKNRSFIDGAENIVQKYDIFSYYLIRFHKKSAKGKKHTFIKLQCESIKCKFAQHCIAAETLEPKAFE